jgi:hypothetical protein
MCLDVITCAFYCAPPSDGRFSIVSEWTRGGTTDDRIDVRDQIRDQFSLFVASQTCMKRGQDQPLEISKGLDAWLNVRCLAIDDLRPRVADMQPRLP